MSLPVVYKHNSSGFGNLVILLADCQDKCNLIHEDAFKYELANCVQISHFERVSYEGTHPPTHIYINPYTVQNIHPRMRSFIHPTAYMKKMIDDHKHLLDGVSACVHIRRGSYSKDSIQLADARHREEIFYHCSDGAVDLFEKKIEREYGKVYVASDSNEIKQRLFSKFGDKLRMIETKFACTAIQTGTNTQSLKTLQDVYLEWFLISMCPKVYLTGGRTDLVGFSTYGYTAAIYGNKPFEIVFNLT